MHGLEGALAAPAADPAWRAAVTTRLDLLREAFGDHMVVTEGPEGLYAALLEHAPRLVPGVQSLIRDHVELIRSMEQVRVRAESLAPQALRGWASNLLRDLSRHRQRGADLVYEAYATDIGGET
jgi:hypothetical protein